MAAQQYQPEHCSAGYARPSQLLPAEHQLAPQPAVAGVLSHVACPGAAGYEALSARVSLFVLFAIDIGYPKPS
jgi:hypothetical protein